MRLLFAEILVGVFFGVACTLPKVKHYDRLLSPHVGSSTKIEIDRILGLPIACIDEKPGKRCEYRTAHATQDPIPDVYRREMGHGPDLSPYDRFDVLHLFFDGQDILQDWKLSQPFKN